MGELWVTVNGKRKRTAKGLKRQYELWDGTEEGKAKRSARNSARRAALRSGRVHKGDGKDVHHSDSNPLNNSPGNLRVLSRASNRGKRGEGSRKRGSKRKRYGV